MSSLGRLAAAATVVAASLVGSGTLATGAGQPASGDDDAPSPAAPAADDEVVTEEPDAASAPIGPGGLVGNEFWPESANVGDCVGMLERPGCGSEARGGWRQALTFGVVAAGLALVATRLVFAVRKRPKASSPS